MTWQGVKNQEEKNKKDNFLSAAGDSHRWFVFSLASQFSNERFIYRKVGNIPFGRKYPANGDDPSCITSKKG